MYDAEISYEDVSVLFTGMSGRMVDSLLHNIHYMGQKQGLQDKAFETYEQQQHLCRSDCSHLLCVAFISKIYLYLLLHDRQPIL